MARNMNTILWVNALELGEMAHWLKLGIQLKGGELFAAVLGHIKGLTRSEECKSRAGGVRKFLYAV